MGVNTVIAMQDRKSWGRIRKQFLWIFLLDEAH